MPTHISLPNERVEQLRMIARAKGTTIPEVIAGFVRDEIAKGTIPAALPGIEISSAENQIIIRAADGFEATVSVDQGPRLADILNGADVGASDPERKKRWLEGAAALSGVKVKRAGNGVKLVSPLTGREFALGLDVAADLGERVRAAAK